MQLTYSLDKEVSPGSNVFQPTGITFTSQADTSADASQNAATAAMSWFQQQVAADTTGSSYSIALISVC